MADYDWRDGEVSKSPSSLDLDEEELFDITDGRRPGGGRGARLGRGATHRRDRSGRRSTCRSTASIFDRRPQRRGSRHACPTTTRTATSTPTTSARSSRWRARTSSPTPPGSSTRRTPPRRSRRLRTRLGHDEVTEVRFYGEYVAAEAPPEAGAEVVDSYEYRGGSIASKETYTPIQPDDVRAAVFSLAAVDGAVVAQAITDAPGRRRGSPAARCRIAYVQRPAPAGGPRRGDRRGCLHRLRVGRGDLQPHRRAAPGQLSTSSANRAHHGRQRRASVSVGGRDLRRAGRRRRRAISSPAATVRSAHTADDRRVGLRVELHSPRPRPTRITCGDAVRCRGQHHSARRHGRDHVVVPVDRRRVRRQPAERAGASAPRSGIDTSAGRSSARAGSAATCPAARDREQLVAEAHAERRNGSRAPRRRAAASSVRATDERSSSLAPIVPPSTTRPS